MRTTALSAAIVAAVVGVWLVVVSRFLASVTQDINAPIG